MPNNELRIVFAGSPQFAARILARMVDEQYTPKLVLTQPDRPQGRKKRLTSTPVKALAEKISIVVETPQDLKGSGIHKTLEVLNPHVMVVAAYGLLLPQSVLDIPQFGCVNVHASLLPRWRGAAPIERAIMAGDSETGVSIMHMEAGLDTGPIYSYTPVALADDLNGEQLTELLAERGATAMIELLQTLRRCLSTGTQPPQPTPQSSEGVTYAKKVTEQDRIPNWDRSAEEVANQVRALSHRDAVRCHIDGVGLQLVQVQPLRDAPATSTDPHSRPGTILLGNKKSELFITCAAGWLQVVKLRLEKGKGNAMSAADARNGYADLFSEGTLLER